MNIHLIGQHLTPELASWASSLLGRAAVYSFATTAELLGAWRLAKLTDSYEAMVPAAVVWLQSRPGQYSQAEVDAVLIADPLARPLVIAGAICAGEPRSGKLLLDVTRLYWHQPLSAFWSVIRPDAKHEGNTVELSGKWIAIHAAQLMDYEGLAGVCQSLGLSTLWQNDRWTCISSEPDYRLFRGWQSWERWCSGGTKLSSAILVLDFPTPDDVKRARELGIKHVLVTPFRAVDLQSCLVNVSKQSSPAIKVHLRSTTVPRVYGRAG